MLNIGIIGCGKIAQARHIPEYADNADCRLMGFYDRTILRAEEMVRKYGGCAYGSYQELLENKGSRVCKCGIIRNRKNDYSETRLKRVQHKMLKWQAHEFFLTHEPAIYIYYLKINASKDIDDNIFNAICENIPI